MAHLSRLTTFPDDAIVVVWSEKGMYVGSSRASERLGDSGMAGLEEVINNAGKQWKDDVLAVAAERFDKRLTEEIGALRVDLAKEFGSVRVEMAKELAAVRSEMGMLRFDLVKWCFVFWIGQVATLRRS